MAPTISPPSTYARPSIEARWHLNELFRRLAWDFQAAGHLAHGVAGPQHLIVDSRFCTVRESTPARIAESSSAPRLPTLATPEISNSL